MPSVVLFAATKFCSLLPKCLKFLTSLSSRIATAFVVAPCLFRRLFVNSTCPVCTRTSVGAPLSEQWSIVIAGKSSKPGFKPPSIKNPKPALSPVLSHLVPIIRSWIDMASPEVLILGAIVASSVRPLMLLSRIVSQYDFSRTISPRTWQKSSNTVSMASPFARVGSIVPGPKSVSAPILAATPLLLS